MERMQVDNNLDIQVDKPRLQFTENCFRWRSAEQWNRTPLEIRQLGNVTLFKKHYRKWILSERSRPPDN